MMEWEEFFKEVQTGDKFMIFPDDEKAFSGAHELKKLIEAGQIFISRSVGTDSYGGAYVEFSDDNAGIWALYDTNHDDIRAGYLITERLQVPIEELEGLPDWEKDLYYGSMQAAQEQDDAATELAKSKQKLVDKIKEHGLSYTNEPTKPEWMGQTYWDNLSEHLKMTYK